MSKIKRQYVHQGWDITVYEDGSFERNATPYPHLQQMETPPPKHRLPSNLEEIPDTKLRRMALNLLVAATEKLNDG